MTDAHLSRAHFKRRLQFFFYKKKSSPYGLTSAPRRITRHPAIVVFRNCVAAVLIARDPHPPSPTQSPHRGGAGEPIAFQRPAPGPARCAKASAPMLRPAVDEPHRTAAQRLGSAICRRPGDRRLCECGQGSWPRAIGENRHHASRTDRLATAHYYRGSAGVR